MNSPDESKSGLIFFFASLWLVCFGIAALFTAQGFWPVLPFAGLEILVLGWALACSRAADTRSSG